MIEPNITESTELTRKANILSRAQWQIGEDLAGSLQQLSRQLNQLAEDLDNNTQTISKVSWHSPAATAVRHQLKQQADTIDHSAFLCHHVHLYLRQTTQNLQNTARDIRAQLTTRHQLLAHMKYLAQQHSTGQDPAHSQNQLAQNEKTVLDIDEQLQRLCLQTENQLEELVRHVQHATSLQPQPSYEVASRVSPGTASQGTLNGQTPLLAPTDTIDLTSVLAATKQYRKLRTGTRNNEHLAGAKLARLRKILMELTPRQRILFTELSPQACSDLAHSNASAATLNKKFPPGTIELTFFSALPAQNLKGSVAVYRNTPLMRDCVDRIRTVAQIWQSLTPDQQSYLASAYPAAIGTLQGVSVGHRVQANRISLHGHHHHTSHLLAAKTQTSNQPRPHSPGTESLNTRELQSRLNAYKTLIDQRFSENPGRGHRQILSFDPTGNGQLVEIIGSLDKNTSHIGTFVPGTGTTLSRHDHYVRSGRHYLTHGTPETMAQIVFTDGHYPQSIPEAATRYDAHHTGKLLAIQQAELAIIAPRAKMTVTGYSYGGAIVGTAESFGMPADHVIHLSSAGMGAPLDAVAEPVTSPEHYPATDLVGRPKRRSADSTGTVRWTHTPAGDAISLAQESSDFIPGTGHGADPEDFPGMRVLPPGRYLPGFDHPGVVGKPLENSACEWGSGLDVHRQVHRPYTSTAQYIGEIAFSKTVPNHEVVTGPSARAEPLARRIIRAAQPVKMTDLVGARRYK